MGCKGPGAAGGTHRGHLQAGWGPRWTLIILLGALGGPGGGGLGRGRGDSELSEVQRRGVGGRLGPSATFRCHIMSTRPPTTPGMGGRGGVHSGSRRRQRMKTAWKENGRVRRG